MEGRIDFIALAQELGGRVENVTLPNGAVMTETKWDPAPGRALLARFDELAAGLAPGEPVEFGGHTDPWVMLGLLHKLRHGKLSTYLPVFGQAVPIEAYAVGAEPVEDQPVLFEVDDQEDYVYIQLRAGTPRLPMELPMSRMNLPPIPAGKTVFLKLGDAKILNLLGLALSLGEDCRALYMEQPGGYYRCAISNAEGIRPGKDRTC